MNGFLTRWAFPAIGAVVWICGVAWAQQTTEFSKRSVRDGVYSAEQAERGDKIYKARCLSCHMTSQFVGDAFMRSWTGQTADSLYDALRNTMPPENPAGLKPQEYADVLAYLLMKNGLPVGTTDLKGSKDFLKHVLIERPSPSGEQNKKQN